MIYEPYKGTRFEPTSIVRWDSIFKGLDAENYFQVASSWYIYIYTQMMLGTSHIQVFNFSTSFGGCLILYIDNILTTSRPRHWNSKVEWPSDSG